MSDLMAGDVDPVLPALNAVGWIEVHGAVVHALSENLPSDIGPVPILEEKADPDLSLGPIRHFLEPKADPDGRPALERGADLVLEGFRASPWGEGLPGLEKRVPEESPIHPLVDVLKYEPRSLA